MTSYQPIRNLAGQIIGMTQHGNGAEQSVFARTLAETMSAVGAVPVAATHTEAPVQRRRRFGRKDIAAIVGGLTLALALIVAINKLIPDRSAQSDIHVTIRPTAAPAAVILPTAAPTQLPQQAAYASPDGALLGTIPAGLPVVYRYGESGWAGVAWQGAIVWVRAERAEIAGLPDLQPQPTAIPAPAWHAPIAPAPVEEAPIDTTHARKHAEEREACWPGVPAPNEDNAPACWRGVPYALP